MGPTASRWSEWRERARTSLFLLPLVAVVAAAGLAATLVAVDSRLDDARELPLVVTSTVDSARQVLSTVAAATISFAGIAFSVALLVIQRTSAQYSPRVVPTLFRDPFNRRVMALVVGTFTYCLLVLRTVRAPDAESAAAAVPDLAVSVALGLGIVSILAVVAFIDHSAKAMDVSRILERVADDHLDTTTSVPDESIALPDDTGPEPDPVHHVVRFVQRGWVQRLDLEQLRSAVPADGTIVVHTAPGRYAVPGAPFCAVSGSIGDPGAVDRCLLGAVSLGGSRTLLQDPGYGLRQSVDVALRALSPGVNDPTTAQDAIFHSAAMLADLLRAPEAPRALRGLEGGRLLLPELLRHDDLVDLAYDEVRRAGASQPTVCVYLLESLRQVQLALRLDDLQAGVDRLGHQARLVVQGIETADVIERDRQLVSRAFESRFPVEGTG